MTTTSVQLLLSPRSLETTQQSAAILPGFVLCSADVSSRGSEHKNSREAPSHSAEGQPTLNGKAAHMAE